MSDKPRADAKLKNLSEEDQNLLWELRTTPQVPMDPDKPRGAKRPLTQKELQVEIPLRFGFTASSGSISEWESWYGLQKRIQKSKARATQAKLEWAKENPDFAPEDLERLGQMVFTAETVEDGDIKNFVALIRANNQKRSLALDERRVKILEEKAKRLEEAEGVTGDPKLTDEEKQRRLKQLFGMG